MTSCGGIGSDADHEFSKEQEDSLLVGDYLFVAKSVHAPFCDTASFMVINKIAPLARSIAKGEPYSLENDSLALALLDSMLDGRDVATRRFYFWVVTKSLERSDGYYSEGVSYWGTQYLLRHPAEFLEIWSRCMCIAEQQEWAYYLASELLMTGSDQPKDTLMKYLTYQLDSVTPIPSNDLKWSKDRLLAQVDSVFSVHGTP